MNGFFAGTPPQPGFYPMPAYAPGPQTRQLTSNDVGLTIRQQPKEALVTQDGKEKSRKPVDPPPILQLHVNQAADPHQHWLQSPYLFVTCALIKADSLEAVKNGQEGKQALTGSLVSSLHRLKDTNNQDGGFFVFGDVSVRVVGTHRLHFSLFDFHKDTREVSFLTSATTEPFKVVPAKDFRGLDESTYLSRAFSDQGVRLRLRKEPRAFTGNKRSFSYTQRHSDDRENSQSGDGIPYDPHYHQQDSQESPKRQNMTDDYGGYDPSQSPHAVRPPSANGNPYSLAPSSYAPEMQSSSQHPDFQRQYVFAGLSSTGQNQYIPATTAAHQGNLYGHNMPTNGYMGSHNNSMNHYRLNSTGSIPLHYTGGPVVPSTEADYSAVNPELPSFQPLLHRADEPLGRPMSRYQEAVEAETHRLSKLEASADF